MQTKERVFTLLFLYATANTFYLLLKANTYLMCFCPFHQWYMRSCVANCYVSRETACDFA